jgi:hypothetical protein
MKQPVRTTVRFIIAAVATLIVFRVKGVVSCLAEAIVISLLPDTDMGNALRVLNIVRRQLEIT